MRVAPRARRGKMESISSARRCQVTRVRWDTAATIVIATESDRGTKANDIYRWLATPAGNEGERVSGKFSNSDHGRDAMNSKVQFARRMMLRGLPILAAIAIAVAVMAISVRHARAAQDSMQEIAVSAKKFDFTPGEIHVKQGTQVRLEVTPTDREHGFELEVYPEGSDKKGDPGLKFSGDKPSFKIPQGQTQAVEFTAVQAGTYDFKCIVYCGSGHRGMKGTIVVEP
jgi:cytochrome c oxidase subunit 2